jgi:hypothetical protein
MERRKKFKRSRIVPIPGYRAALIACTPEEEKDYDPPNIQEEDPAYWVYERRREAIRKAQAFPELPENVEERTIVDRRDGLVVVWARKRGQSYALIRAKKESGVRTPSKEPWTTVREGGKHRHHEGRL